MHRTALAAVLTLAVAAGLTGVARADTKTWGFEPPSFAPGDIHGQAGWLKPGTYDAAVVTNGPSAPASFGTQSLRISNAVTFGNYTDQTVSPGLVDAAGEADSAAGQLAGGVRQPHFEATIRIASADPAAEQPGLAITLSPVRGDDDTRMGFVRVSDTPGGLAVDVVDTPSPATDSGGSVNFVSHDGVATALDRALPHTIRIAIDFGEDTDDDVLEVWVDGTLRFTGTTWENYWRNDVEQQPNGNVVPATDSVLIGATSDPPAPATDGKGFLVDGVSLTSSGAPAQPGPQGDPGPAGATGPAGPTGPTGPAGADGAAGAPGATGATGAPGATGATGAAGPTGTAGAPGANGLSAVSVGYPVDITSGKVDVRTRRVKVTLACPAAAGLCDGVLRLRTLAGRELAERSFDMDGGRKLALTVTFPRSQAKALQRAGKVRAVVLARGELGVAARSARLLRIGAAR